MYARKKPKLVHGVGINDALFPIYDGEKSIPSYETWKGMLKRCYSDKYQHREYYKDCTVHRDWLSFAAFHDWYLEQNAPADWHLDKDLLQQGNKIYSAETCVLVPHSLNLFANEHNKDRGEFPIGVVAHQCGKYQAKCRVAGKNKHLGLYLTPEQAHHAYRLEKWKQAQAWMDEIQSNPQYLRKDEICESLERRYSV